MADARSCEICVLNGGFRPPNRMELLDFHKYLIRIGQ